MKLHSQDLYQIIVVEQDLLKKMHYKLVCCVLLTFHALHVYDVKTGIMHFLVQRFVFFYES